MILADTVLVEIDVLGAFESDGRGPIHSCFVIVVYCDAVLGIVKTEVNGAVFDAQEIVDAFVGGVDFGNAGAICCLILSDGFPGDRAASAADNIAREGPILE
jgi:hypothetical protein